MPKDDELNVLFSDLDMFVDGLTLSHLENSSEVINTFSEFLKSIENEIDEFRQKSLNLGDHQLLKESEADESDDETFDTSELEKELSLLTLAKTQPYDQTLDTSELENKLNSLTLHDWLKETFPNTNSSGIQQMINAQTNDLPRLMKTIAEQKTKRDFYRFWAIIPEAGCGSGRRKETSALYEAIKTLTTPFSGEQLKTAYEQELNKEQPSLFKQWFGL